MEAERSHFLPSLLLVNVKSQQQMSIRTGVVLIVCSFGRVLEVRSPLWPMTYLTTYCP